MRLKRKLTHRPLNVRERLHLCSFMRLLVPIARDHGHPMRKLARAQISILMWRWTADGTSLKTGAVCPDVLKYDVRQLPCTAAAGVIAATTIKDLRHEHIVPRILLTDHIIEQDMTQRSIFKFLTRFCKSVIVTKEEDVILSRSNMPTGWTWEEGCVYARYRIANLYEVIENPQCEQAAPEQPLPAAQFR